MSNYTIRRTSKKDFPILVSLMKSCFKKDVKNDYFQWRYEDNPSGKAIGFLAESSKGEPAAFYAFLPRTYSVNGELKIFYQSVDGMTHANHRKKGLFRLLHVAGDNYLQEENKVGISYSGPITVNVKLDYGWQRVTTIKYYFFPKYLAYFYSKKKFDRVDLIQDLNKLSKPFQSANASSFVKSYKSPEIYHWRISNPRDIKYEVFGYKNDNGSYSSYVTTFAQGNQLILFDFHFNDNAEGRILINFLKEKMKVEGKMAIVAFCQKKSDLSEILMKLNFLTNNFNKGPLHQTMPFTIFDQNSSETLLNGDNWSLTYFGYDAG